jgi:hypothetical protein
LQSLANPLAQIRALPRDLAVHGSNGSVGGEGYLVTHLTGEMRHFCIHGPIPDVDESITGKAGDELLGAVEGDGCI